MNNTAIICTILCAFFALLLLLFSLFAVGFFIGYCYEEKRITKKQLNKSEEDKFFESEEEKKIKRDWKNFLKYDGSAADSRE